MARLQKKLVHEGDYVADVEVQLVECDEGWSPYLTLDDAERLDQVREALRRGDVTEAAKLARGLSPSRLSEDGLQSAPVRLCISVSVGEQYVAGCKCIEAARHGFVPLASPHVGAADLPV